MEKDESESESVKAEKRKIRLPLFYGFSLKQVLDAQTLVSVDLHAIAEAREKERQRYPTLDFSEHDRQFDTN
jgi:hypothetical protein